MWHTWTPPLDFWEWGETLDKALDIHNAPYTAVSPSDPALNEVPEVTFSMILLTLSFYPDQTRCRF